MAATFVDAHCHLDQCEDPAKAVRSAEQAGIVVVAVTETPDQYVAVERSFAARRTIRVALGLHPLRVEQVGAPGIRSFLARLPSVDYVGEVGLDFSKQGRATKLAQLRALEQILAAPEARAKVWSVHSRRAEEDTIRLLEAARVPATLHWYSGPTRLIDRACAAGLYFSVNLGMLLTSSGREIIKAIPRERIVTESEAP